MGHMLTFKTEHHKPEDAANALLSRSNNCDHCDLSKIPEPSEYDPTKDVEIHPLHHGDSKAPTVVPSPYRLAARDSGDTQPGWGSYKSPVMEDEHRLRPYAPNSKPKLTSAYY